MATLLEPDEVVPGGLAREAPGSNVLLVCDHGGNRVPRRLRDLGVEEGDLQRHIAWDIGAAGLARELAVVLDATLVLQPYSRLVIDCNRTPGTPQSIVKVSDGTPIPGNEHIDDAGAALRSSEIFEPYHGRIRHELDTRAQRGQTVLLLSIHSFTPVLAGKARPWQVGLLYNRDARVADAIRAPLREQGLCVGDNEPYSVSDETDYAIPVHGERRGIPHLEIEVRQDLIATASGQREWSERLGSCLLPLCTRSSW